MKQISVRVSDNMHQSLREKTVKDKTTAQSVLELLLAVYLDSEDDYDTFQRKIMTMK